MQNVFKIKDAQKNKTKKKQEFLSGVRDTKYIKKKKIKKIQEKTDRNTNIRLLIQYQRVRRRSSFVWLSG